MFIGLAALAAATIAPGLWEVRNVPTAASIDGRPLTDLPLSEIRSEQVCLTAREAAAPAAWFAHDTADICRITQGKVAHGKVAIRGACPTDIKGKDGTLALDGHYDATSYAIAFTTTTPQPEGVMGFTGKLSGRRLGACPAIKGEKGR